MKTVKILGDALNKVADTSTVFDFRLWNGGQAQDVTGKTVSFTIANDSGYLFDVPAVVDGNVISLDFSNELLKQLTPDTYHMEVSVTNGDGDVEVYPSDGAIDFRVGKNLHSTQGKLVPQITFDTVLREVDEKITEYTKTIAKGETGPAGPQGPQGERGKQIFKSNSEYYDQNSLGHWWSDLTPAVSADNPPKIGDTVITSSGDVFQINTVNVGDGGGGGGTFGVGGLLGNIKGPQGPKGDTGAQGPQGLAGVVDYSQAVNTTGNQTVAGDKTFTSPIIGTLKTYEIKDGYDMNGYKTDGTFFINGAKNLVNYPANASAWATLVVHAISNTTATQTLIDTNNDIYIRTLGGDPAKWGSWSKQVNESTTQLKIYGLGTVFTTDSYLAMAVSGKLVSIQGALTLAKDVTGGAYVTETGIIPSQYVPVAERKHHVSYNASSASNKVWADWSILQNGNLSIDNIQVGGDTSKWGTITAGAVLNFSDTWVIA